MIRGIPRWRWGAALLVPLLFWACEQAPVPTAAEPPPELLQPSFARGGDSYGWKPVAGSIPMFSASKLIGPEGGQVGVEGFTLVVPKGAVAAETEFVFKSGSKEFIQVALTATSQGGELNDVGSAGFAVPLRLSLSFDAAGGAPEWSRLRVAWLRPDGVLEPVPTRINVRSKVATGFIEHFSDYALALPF